jgi:hypothetical protein
MEKCGYGNFNHRYNVSSIHLHALLGVRNLRRWSACAPIPYEVVRYCRKLYHANAGSTTSNLAYRTVHVYFASLPSVISYRQSSFSVENLLWVSIMIRVARLGKPGK